MTGNFENWAGNIADIGPIYPFVGSEWLLWIVGVALWLVWHFVQAGIERSEYDEEVRRYGRPETLRQLVGREDPENP